MLGDGCVGVHHRNCDLIDSVELYNQIFMSLSAYPSGVGEIELRLVLKIMLRFMLVLLGPTEVIFVVELFA